MIKTSELRTKPVIEIKDGRKLGNINDIEFDLSSGRVTGIVVPTAEKYWKFFSRGGSIVIPWESIMKIGADVILVNVKPTAPESPTED